MSTQADDDTQSSQPLAFAVTAAAAAADGNEQQVPVEASIELNQLGLFQLLLLLLL